MNDPLRMSDVLEQRGQDSLSVDEELCVVAGHRRQKIVDRDRPARAEAERKLRCGSIASASSASERLPGEGASVAQTSSKTRTASPSSIMRTTRAIHFLPSRSPGDARRFRRRSTSSPKHTPIAAWMRARVRRVLSA